MTPHQVNRKYYIDFEFAFNLNLKFIENIK